MRSGARGDRVSVSFGTACHFNQAVLSSVVSSSATNRRIQAEGLIRPFLAASREKSKPEPVGAADRADPAAVEEAGRRVVEKHGEQGLRQVAKMHFRTAYRVLGLPEPAKVEWKRRV